MSLDEELGIINADGFVLIRERSLLPEDERNIGIPTGMAAERPATNGLNPIYIHPKHRKPLFEYRDAIIRPPAERLLTTRYRVQPWLLRTSWHPAEAILLRVLRTSRIRLQNTSLQSQQFKSYHEMELLEVWGPQFLEKASLIRDLNSGYRF
ncbi:hypothetical protein LTS15_003825 [Exophiala xenobiotica]|nr:hypothetical protein LTS15_003825 [Exophiala xenobiotica]